MEMRLARRTDISALSSLWQECFGDEDEYIALFYRHRFDSIRVAVATDGGGAIIGMIHLLPCEIKDEAHVGRNAIGRNAFGTNAYYLYAVGASRAWRGRGVMRALMTSLIDECEGRSIALLLSPVNEHLHAYYRSYGFELAAGDYLDFFDLAELGAPSDVHWCACGAEDYFAARTACLAGSAHVAFSADAVAYALSENEFCGGTALVSSAGDCALVQKAEGHLVLREACVSTAERSLARARLAALLAALGATSCELRSHLALSEHAQLHQTVMAYGKDLRAFGCYMNLLLD